MPEARGNQALIAAGTGLGQAGLAWDGAHHVPFACEGGHASLAPADEEQDALLRFLRDRHGHVSWERVVPGPGLVKKGSDPFFSRPRRRIRALP